MFNIRFINKITKISHLSRALFAGSTAAAARHDHHEGGTRVRRQVHHLDDASGAQGPVGPQAERPVLPGTRAGGAADVADGRDEPPVPELLVPALAHPRLRVPLHPHQQGQDGPAHHPGRGLFRAELRADPRLPAGRADHVGGPVRGVVPHRRGGRQHLRAVRGPGRRGPVPAVVGPLVVVLVVALVGVLVSRFLVQRPSAAARDASRARTPAGQTTTTTTTTAADPATAPTVSAAAAAARSTTTTGDHRGRGGRCGSCQQFPPQRRQLLVARQTDVGQRDRVRAAAAAAHVWISRTVRTPLSVVLRVHFQLISFR